jgi:hypothetical protein
MPTRADRRRYRRGVKQVAIDQRIARRPEGLHHVEVRSGDEAHFATL